MHTLTMSDQTQLHVKDRLREDPLSFVRPWARPGQTPATTMGH